MLPTSTSGVGIHIQTSYIALATLLGTLYPFMLSMRALLDKWVGAEMELPSLLASIINRPVAYMFWMTLQFHLFFHAARTQPNLGPLTVLCMTELKQLRLHMFKWLALPLPACYLLATWKQPTITTGPKTTGEGVEGTSQSSTWVLNPQPNPTF